MKPTNIDKILAELEVIIKKQLNKYMGRLVGDKKCRDGSYIPQPILDYVESTLTQFEKDIREDDRKRLKVAEESIDIEDIFNLLNEHGLSPEYIDIDDVGFSRWVRFETKYQTCWIEWYKNVSTLRVGDKWGVRIPFTDIMVENHSPSNNLEMTFRNRSFDQFVKGKLIDYEVSLTLKKLDWQEAKSLSTKEE